MRKVFLVLLLALSTSANSQQLWLTKTQHTGDVPVWQDQSSIYWTGNDLYGWCTSKSLACEGYVSAVADVAAALNAIPACIPKGVIVRQLVDVTTAYLKGHAETRQHSALALTMAAYTEAFPCSSH
jgi:Rap1a immunity proteins